MIELDNKKMWESILKELWYWPQKEALVLCIKNALRDQGLNYNSKTKKIESIEPEPFEIKKGNWYMCIKTLDGWGGPYMEGEVYQSPANGVIFHREGFDIENETKLLHGRPENKNNMSLYFRPATPEEIPHNIIEQTKVPTDTYIADENGVRKLGSESEQEELNEFEKEIAHVLVYKCYDGSLETEEKIHNAYRQYYDDAKFFAPMLLAKARKQIASEINIDERVQKFKDGVEESPHGILACLTLHGAYKLGMDDTLKAIKGE